MIYVNSKQVMDNFIQRLKEYPKEMISKYIVIAELRDAIDDADYAEVKDT